MKTLNDIYKQYEGIIKLLVMVLPLVFASWQYVDKYIDVPARMDAFEDRAKRDSIYYSKIIKDNRHLDSIQNLFLESDYTAIEKLKTQVR
jgi:hypothetical protein